MNMNTTAATAAQLHIITILRSNDKSLTLLKKYGRNKKAVLLAGYFRRSIRQKKTLKRQPRRKVIPTPFRIDVAS